MNLDFSDDQKFLQEEARKFLEKENALSRNRSVLENNANVDVELWNKIVELGWTGIRIPEEYSGLGLGHLELCVIAEELGRFLAPVPFSSSVYLYEIKIFLTNQNFDFTSRTIFVCFAGKCWKKHKKRKCTHPVGARFLSS